MSTDNQAVADVERAMVAIRRLQAKRALSGTIRSTIDPAVIAVVDVVEECADADRPCTVNAVAQALSVDQPRASRLVARAVEAALVIRRADQADGRRALLELT